MKCNIIAVILNIDIVQNIFKNIIKPIKKICSNTKFNT